GRALAFAYDNQNHLSDVSVNGAVVAHFDYLGKADAVLLGQYYPGGIPPDIMKGTAVVQDVVYPNTSNETVTYAYEDANNPFALTGVTDARGVRYSTWTYDA